MSRIHILCTLFKLINVMIKKNDKSTNDINRINLKKKNNKKILITDKETSHLTGLNPPENV